MPGTNLRQGGIWGFDQINLYKICPIIFSYSAPHFFWVAAKAVTSSTASLIPLVTAREVIVAPVNA